MAQKGAVSTTSHPPHMLPSCELCHKNGLHEGFLLPEKEVIGFNSAEMFEYIRYVQRYEKIQPRTYWTEFPFYIIIKSRRQKFCMGYRPEDLTHIETIEQKVWKKHQSHLNRLEYFPLDKAEYYLRLKEAHGINTVRGLSKITGEDWSYIAKLLRILSLPKPIKKFLRNNKEDPVIVKLFPLRKLLDIIRQGEERMQLARFGELLGEVEVGFNGSVEI